MAPRRGNRGRPPILSVRNEDYTDREVLLMIARVERRDGTILATDACEEFGLNPEDPKQRKGMTIRLAWLKRFGLVDKVDARSYGGKASDPPRYIITPFGRMVMRGKLPAAVQRAIDDGDVGADVLIIRKLISKAYLEVGGPTSTVVRREYLHLERKRPR